MTLLLKCMVCLHIQIFIYWGILISCFSTIPSWQVTLYINQEDKYDFTFPVTIPVSTKEFRLILSVLGYLQAIILNYTKSEAICNKKPKVNCRKFLTPWPCSFNSNCLTSFLSTTFHLSYCSPYFSPCKSYSISKCTNGSHTETKPPLTSH